MKRRTRTNRWMAAAMAVWAAVAASAPGAEPAGGTDLEDSLRQEIERSLLEAEERRQRAANQVRYGRRMLEAQQYEQAMKAFVEALRLDPTNAEAVAGRDEASRYLQSRETVTRAAVDQEIERARISEQFTTAQALNNLDKARLLYREAMEPVAEDLPLEIQATDIQARLRALDGVVKNAERALLRLDSLPARIDTEREEREARLLGVQVRQRRETLEARLQEVNSRIALDAAAAAKAEAASYIGEKKDYLVERAREYMRRYEYEKAERIVREVKAMDLGDNTADMLLQDIRRERLRHRHETTSDLASEERRLVLERIERAAIPVTKAITYPENWNELERRRELLQQRGVVGEEANQDILRQMETRYSVVFEETPIQDAVMYLRDMTGLNIVYKQPEDMDAEEIPPVSLQVNDMRLENIFQWLITITNLRYEIRDGVIFITSQSGLMGKPRIEVYDVRDLGAVRDAGAAPTGDSDDADDGFEGDQLPLNEIIEKVLVEDFGEDRGTVFLDEGNLTVTASPEGHRRVLDLLSKLRAAQAIQVSITSRFLTITDDFWEQFDSQFGEFNNYLTGAVGKLTSQGHGQHNTDVNGSLQFNAISGIFSVLGNNLGSTVSPNAGMKIGVVQAGWMGQIQSQWFMRAVKESQKADELFAPHLIVYNNRYAWIRSDTDVTYIAGYNRAAAGEALEPAIEMMHEGSTLRVRPTVSPDKKYITLDVHPNVTKILGVATVSIREEIGVRGVTELPIELPTTFEHDARTFATLPDGGSILLSGLAVNVHMKGRTGVPLLSEVPYLGNLFSNRVYQKEKRNLVIMLNARMILLDEEEAKQTR